MTEIVNEIIIIVETKGAIRKEYLRAAIQILMDGGGVEEIRNIKISPGAHCCI